MEFEHPDVVTEVVCNRSTRKMSSLRLDVSDTEYVQMRTINKNLRNRG